MPAADSPVDAAPGRTVYRVKVLTGVSGVPDGALLRLAICEVRPISDRSCFIICNCPAIIARVRDRTHCRS